MIKKGLLLCLTAALLAACAARHAAAPPQTAQQRPVPPEARFNVEEKIAEAESLAMRQTYVRLRRAFSLYQEIEKHSPGRGRFAKGYAMTALLLAVRAKEVGLRNGEYLGKARELVTASESLAGLAPALAVADFVPVKTEGVWSDEPEPGPGAEKKLPASELLASGLAAHPEAAPFFAYFRVLLLEQAGQIEPAKSVLDKALAEYPDSLLLKYKRATTPPGDRKLLEEIADKEPEFFEAFLEQGRIALEGGALITAEKHFLRAHEGIPDSPRITILLAGVNFGTEEYDRSLDFYEKTLALAPGYMEALLGEAICLSCQGRCGEAIPHLEDLMARGPSLKGECLFWLAADLHEMGEDERAAAEIEQAKPVLPVARVYTLAGTIALERDLPDAAERDLKIAVGMDTGESDAFFGLGKLYARKKAWPDSALNFMFAGLGFESDEKKIIGKIGQVEGSPMPEDRKARLLARKKGQLEKTRLTKATAQFNAAAGYFNSGDLEKARTWARQAAAHPYFADKAKEFMALAAARK